MAIGVDHLRLSQTDRVNASISYMPIQRLVDEGAVYVSQAFTASQFATLNALFHRLVSPVASPVVSPAQEDSGYLAARLDRDLASGDDASRGTAYFVGLDELDLLSLTRAGYGFRDLTPEIQDAVLELVAAGDLTSDRLNLALWLVDLRRWVAHCSVAAR